MALAKAFSEIIYNITTVIIVIVCLHRTDGLVFI